MSSTSGTTPSSSMTRISRASSSSTRRRISSRLAGEEPTVIAFLAFFAQPVIRFFLSRSSGSSISARAWRFGEEWKRSGKCDDIVSCTWAATFQPTRSISSNGPIGSPSGTNACSTSVSSVPSSIARAASPMTFARRRFTMNPGASAEPIAFLRSFFAMTYAVETASSDACGVRTTSTSGITATGLKKWKPTRRSGWERTDPISSTESDDVFVARMASSATYCSISRNTSCLTDVSSNTASITKSQAAKSALSVVPVTSERRRFAVSVSIRPLSSSLPISEWIEETPFSTRSAETSVMTTGTCRRRTKSSANCVAMSPAPITPTFVTGRARSLSGAPTGRFARFCTRSNAYIDAANSSLAMRSASASSSRANPASFVPLAACSRRSRAR